MACQYEYQGKWYTEKGLQAVFNQLGGDKTIPSKASPATIGKIKEFLNRIGVDIQPVASIIMDGRVLGVNGIADPLNSLIQVVQGKEDVALTEEAMHMAVEIIQQKNPALFRKMLNSIGSFNITSQIFNDYGSIKAYQKEGKPDVLKLKKEAIGKVLAQVFINKSEDSNENPALLAQTKTWWQQIIDFLKQLFLKAQMNPFEQAAGQILSGDFEGNAQDLTGSSFASRNPNIVNATLKLVSALRDPKAAKWYKSLPWDTFLTKVQQDLQAPKSQVDMLKNWATGKKLDSIDDLITGVMSELSYAVEINVATETYKRVKIDPITDRPTGEPVTEESTSRHYEQFNVPGGTNYKENEIKTPAITPSIKGHAQFATDQGIGWFRSDDKTAKVPPDNVELDRDVNEYTQNGEPISKEQFATLSGGATKIRRILELQSDLFQKGRERSDLISPEYLERVNNMSHSELLAEKETLDKVSVFGLIGNQDLKLDAINRKLAGKEIITPNKENDFLQLLNKENNWVTFFVKAIIQDSAKKGYENVRFPGGSTANKIEGQTTVEEFIKSKEERINDLRGDIKRLGGDPDFNSFYAAGGFADYFTKDGKYYTGFQGEEPIEITEEDYRKEYEISKQRRKTDIEDLNREIAALEKEIADAQGPNGMGKFGAIARFYETTVHNVLKKQGYKPNTVTDEYGNKWFEITLDKNRDLGDFYFQISGNQSVTDKLKEINQNVARTEDGFEINGEKIRHTVAEKVEKAVREKRFERPVTDVQRANREFKQTVEKDTKTDLFDILGRYISDDNTLRDSPLEQSLPSVVNPYNNSSYLTLEGHIAERLATYPTGTKFFKDLNIYDDRTSTAGTVDLLAVLPDGKIDILQFKVPDTGARTDIPVYLLSAYDVEIENLRKILQNGYAIPRNSFRQTRAIPIRAIYTYNILGDARSGLRLDSLNIGGTNVAAITDPITLPVASRSESTGDEDFDRFIFRLTGLADKMAKERVPPDKRLEKSTRVARLIASIRRLKVQRKAEGIISSAKVIMRRQQEKLVTLREQIANVDPLQATDKQLNDLAQKITDEKDEVELYADMYSVFKEIFSDGTEESKVYIAQARDIADDADSIVKQYWKMSVDFRKEKMAANQGIKDEFNPEKQLTWYRKMIRSLSQSSLKAGALLWGLVKRINSRLETEFDDRLTKLKKVEEGVDEWLKGKNIKDLYNKIFQFKDGKWNGRFIQKYSKDFYTELKTAQEAQDIRWVRANIDVEAYNRWYQEERLRMVENARTARVHEDDERNRQLIRQSLQDFINTFSLHTSRGVNPNNYHLKDFPLDKWYSTEYQEILRPENRPLLDLYDYWRERLEESLDSGMISEHQGWSWFPNVRRNLLEKLTTAPAAGKLKNLVSGLRIEPEDTLFGKIDPITGKSIDEIHASYVSDLGEWVKGADDNYFLDYSEKSMDLFKVMAMWEKEIVKFKLKTESEGLAKLLAYTEENRKAHKTTKTGKLLRDENGFPILISNEVNAKYIKEHIEAVWYGKQLADESDISIDIPYKSVVERINKLFGKTIIPVPEQESITISGVKGLHSMNRYFTMKTLGLNVFTSIAQLFGGSVNTYINQGKFFDKKDILESELEYTSGTFWDGEQRKKMAGLLAYFHISSDDKTAVEIRKLSVSKAVQFFSSDHLFIGQRIADNAVNNVITMSYIKNTMVKDGQLVNIREYARQELGHGSKYAQGSTSAKEFETRLDERVEQLKKSPEALINVARIENDEMVIPGVDRNSDTLVNFREGVKQFIRNALGNTTKEDLSLYKRSIMWQSFFMFKNWIPRMLDVRGQTLKYNPGSQSYEWGRMRMLTNAVYNLVKNTNTSLLKTLGGNKEDIITVAKQVYKQKQQEFAEQEEDFNMNEAEFVDMYIKGVRAQFKELGLALGMFGVLVAARAAAPDQDEEAHVRGSYKWMLRGIDKLQDEVSFFYNPISFMNVFNGSVFPAVNLLVDIQKFFYTGIKKGFYSLIGDEEKADKQHASKYLFKIMPITKELMTYVAIFNDDLAKEYGIRLSSQYGSLR